VGTAIIAPSCVVRDLGIYLDSNLSMTTHISKTVSNCFAAMRLIRSVRRSVSKAVSLSLVTALVLSRVDYGNATLAGLPARQLCQLQSVLHAAARIVFRARKFAVTVDFQASLEDVPVCYIVLVTLILVLLVFGLPNMSTLSVIMLRVLEVYLD